MELQVETTQPGSDPLMNDSEETSRATDADGDLSPDVVGATGSEANPKVKLKKLLPDGMSEDDPLLASSPRRDHAGGEGEGSREGRTEAVIKAEGGIGGEEPGRVPNGIDDSGSEGHDSGSRGGEGDNNDKNAEGRGKRVGSSNGNGHEDPRNGNEDDDEAGTAEAEMELDENDGDGATKAAAEDGTSKPMDEESKTDEQAAKGDEEKAEVKEEKEEDEDKKEGAGKEEKGSKEDEDDQEEEEEKRGRKTKKKPAKASGRRQTKKPQKKQTTSTRDETPKVDTEREVWIHEIIYGLPEGTVVGDDEEVYEIVEEEEFVVLTPEELELKKIEWGLILPPTKRESAADEIVKQEETKAEEGQPPAEAEKPSDAELPVADKDKAVGTASEEVQPKPEPSEQKDSVSSEAGEAPAATTTSSEVSTADPKSTVEKTEPKSEGSDADGKSEDATTKEEVAEERVDEKATDIKAAVKEEGLDKKMGKSEQKMVILEEVYYLDGANLR
jgi:hypothetical protein